MTFDAGTNDLMAQRLFLRLYQRELGDYEMGSIITDWLLWNNAIVDRGTCLALRSRQQGHWNRYCNNINWIWLLWFKSWIIYPTRQNRALILRRSAKGRPSSSSLAWSVAGAKTIRNGDETKTASDWTVKSVLSRIYTAPNNGLIAQMDTPRYNSEFTRGK